MTNFKIGDKVRVISGDWGLSSDFDYLGLIGVVVDVYKTGVAVDFGIAREGFHHLSGKLPKPTGRWLNPKALALVNEEDFSMYEELFV